MSRAVATARTDLPSMSMLSFIQGAVSARDLSHDIGDAGRPVVNVGGRVDCTDVVIVQANLGKKMGDVNRDGKLDDNDLTFVTSTLLKGMRCPDQLPGVP